MKNRNRNSWPQRQSCRPSLIDATAVDRRSNQSFTLPQSRRDRVYPNHRVDEFQRWQRGKYLFRAGQKGDAITDLRKAAWYVDREIQRLSKLKAKKQPRARKAGAKGGNLQKKAIWPRISSGATSAKRSRLVPPLVPLPPPGPRVRARRSWGPFWQGRRALCIP
jgi:hypothetical protein